MQEARGGGFARYGVYPGKQIRLPHLARDLRGSNRAALDKRQMDLLAKRWARGHV